MCLLAVDATRRLLRPKQSIFFSDVSFFSIFWRSSSTEEATSTSTATTKTTNESQNKSLRKCIISKICVRDLAKPRSFHVDDVETKLVTDYNSIIEDESIDLVVEVMGGTGLARTVVLESLKRGKSVVTANKALIAEHLDEIRNVVLETEGKAVFAYEAAVCGGIPIIQALQNCYNGDIVHEVMVCSI